jgi:hypothetical protein
MQIQKQFSDYFYDKNLFKKNIKEKEKDSEKKKLIRDKSNNFIEGTTKFTTQITINENIK